MVSLSLLLATPALIFWLWLVILPASVAKLCPEKCRCDAGGYYVECSSALLTAVPLIHLTYVRVLRLSYNEITLLENNSFVSMTELQLLVANECGLEKIELGAFNGLTNLTQLQIVGNSIKEILPGTFECMNILENLDLSENSLQHLGIGVFSGLVNLKYILLSLNHLEYLHPDTFLGSPNLQNLKLDFNRGLQVPTDRNFINSKSLSHLDISDCNVRSVSVETFTNISALKYINLSNNKLRTVHVNILTKLPNLSQIYMKNNPLQCDCQLQEVWRWCENRNIDTGTGYRRPHCHTPREVKEMFWGVLESGKCSEGNIQYYGDYKNKIYKYPAAGEYENEFDVEFLKHYQVAVYAVPFIFGTIANVVLLIIIIGNKDMRTVPNMYILHLAISDIIYSTILFSEACVHRIHFTWFASKSTCIFFSFSRRLSVGLSAYSVALYSIQRYRVIVRPLQVRVSSQPKWRNIVATFCGVWIVAALFAVPSTLSRSQCLENLYSPLVYLQRVVIFELLVSCALPLCVIAFTYTMTVHHLEESCRSISEGTRNPQHKTRRNSAKIVVGLTVVFVISYVPYHLIWTYFICSKERIFSIIYKIGFNNWYYTFQYMYLISNFSLLINPCLNPVALFFTSSHFRQHLKRYLTRFCKKSSPPNDFELARIN